ncbi:MAG TPA: sodium-dependent transporter, partial [Cyclobacteriaceae bacterium]|nr:sodium-dependent transporter [Cyclobacteriaceae bacterium]
MERNRPNFSSRIGFIAAAAGSAIGLGNIWRFPFLVGLGGGAIFLLVYLIIIFSICYPILITEIAIGRGAQKSASGAFRSLRFPNWSFIGLLTVVCSVLILSFYIIVSGWVLGYFVEILTGNFNIGQQFSGFTSDIFRVSVYSILFMAATATIVSGGVTRGIERANRIMMPLLFTILIFLVVYSLTLPGAREGLKFYLIPDFSKINLSVIYSALGQGFFSLSLGMGTMLTYGSYLSRKENIPSSAVIITLADFSIAFMAGLMIFPMVFTQGISTQGGTGLVFIAMPGIFGTMGPVFGTLIGSLFFLLLGFAALTSTISLLELPVSYFVD